MNINQTVYQAVEYLGKLAARPMTVEQALDFYELVRDECQNAIDSLHVDKTNGVE